MDNDMRRLIAAAAHGNTDLTDGCLYAKVTDTIIVHNGWSCNITDLKVTRISDGVYYISFDRTNPNIRKVIGVNFGVGQSESTTINYGLTYIRIQHSKPMLLAQIDIRARDEFILIDQELVKHR